MAVEFYYKASGTYRKAKELYYKSGGTWRKAKEIWYKASGTWRKVFSGFAINTGFSPFMINVVASPAIRTAVLNFFNDGTCSQTPSGTPGNWGLPTTAGVGSGWSIRLTAVGPHGTNFGGMVPGTWYSLSTSRSISVTNSGTTVEGFGQFTVDFSTDGGSSIDTTLTNAIDWDVGYTP